MMALFTPQLLLGEHLPLPKRMLAPCLPWLQLPFVPDLKLIGSTDDSHATLLKTNEFALTLPLILA